MYIATYGTLCRNHVNHHLLDDGDTFRAQYLGTTTIRGYRQRGVLLDRDTESSITVEVYTLTKPHYTLIDHFERSAGFYPREHTVTVQDTQHTVTLWIYEASVRGGEKLYEHN